MTLGGISGVNEATLGADSSASATRKSVKWTTEQNLVLLSGWIKYGTNSVVGRNQKSESFWGKIAEYCNEHCSFDPPRSGVSCRNHYNYINQKLGIIQLYKQVYLRAPTEDALQRILHVSEMRGFRE
ncbi:hypothetical protein Bca101_086868 [Brassica carinata]